MVNPSIIEQGIVVIQIHDGLTEIWGKITTVVSELLYLSEGSVMFGTA